MNTLASPAAEQFEIHPEVHNPLLYSTYEEIHSQARLANLATQTWARSMRFVANLAHLAGMPVSPAYENTTSFVEAADHMTERLAHEYGKPEFGLHETHINGERVGVTEELVHRAPFGSLLHFKRETIDTREALERNDPPVLIVAPMSGHYATLLRDTVRQLLPAHDVYITDWANARDVPASEGSFGLEDYIDYVAEYVRQLGPDTNVLAICQATVPTLAAVAHLAETEPKNEPATVMLMAGPIDTRAASSEVTKFAQDKDLNWFQKNVIGKVPHKYTGAGKLVYPGFLQLAAFVAMNKDKHVESHKKLFAHFQHHEVEQASKLAGFYDEYQAVLDLDAKFYLETISQVFLEQHLARGIMQYRGRLVDLGVITKAAVMTVEGAQDDICPPGQTVAAHSLLSGLKPRRKFHHVQKGAGHYGVFSGSRWAKEIAPRLTSFIRDTAMRREKVYDLAPAESPRIKPELWTPGHTTPRPTTDELIRLHA